MKQIKTEKKIVENHMGCGNSRAVLDTATQRSTRSVTQLNSRRHSTYVSKTPTMKNEFSDFFNFIVSDLSGIKTPPGMVPCVCLSKDSFPIVASNLFIDQDQPTDIQLPIVAGSIAKQGHLMCFAHIQMITRTYFEMENMKFFIHNAFLWIASQYNSLPKILMIGIQQSYEHEIKRNLEKQGFVVDVGNINNISKEYQLVIMTNSIDLKDPNNRKALNDFSEEGHGIAFFYDPTLNDDPLNSSEINSFLSQYGLSFTYCALNDGNAPAKKVSFSRPYESIKDIHFMVISEQFMDFLEKYPVDTLKLDDFVTTLRYYVVVCGEPQLEVIESMQDKIWSFLDKSNYNSVTGLCPSIIHSIAIVLLEDLVSKLPLSKLRVNPLASLFPGIAHDLKLESHTIKLELEAETLVSTGLWLPPGKIATVEYDGTFFPGLMIQVGSHNLSLLAKKGPWKRWPSVVFAYPLIEKSETQVFTSFGGIVYIACAMLPEGKNAITFKFNGFSPFTRSLSSDPQIYQNTKDIDVPWCELESESIILTVPKACLDKFTGFDTFFHNIEDLVQRIVKFMGYEIKRKYRVVFDVETIDGSPIPDYPIVLECEDNQGVMLDFALPTKRLYDLIVAIALVSIRDGCFDEMTEKALASFVATVIFSELFEDFDPTYFAEVTFPILFKELNFIHTKLNNTVIPTIIQNCQDSSIQVFTVDDDKWTSFVRDLCRIGKMNYTKLFEKSRAIPLNIASTLDGLPPLPESILNCF